MQLVFIGANVCRYNHFKSKQDMVSSLSIGTVFIMVKNYTLQIVYPLRINRSNSKFYKNPFNQNIFKPINEHITEN